MFSGVKEKQFLLNKMCGNDKLFFLLSIALMFFFYVLLNIKVLVKISFRF